MSHVVNCEPWHLLYVAFRSPERDCKEAVNVGVDIQTLAARRAVEHGVRFTIVTPEGEPKVCFGISDTAVPGVGYMWMIRSEDAARYAKTGYKTIREIVKAAQYRRIESIASAECQPCRAFLFWLGFVFEGTKRAFFADGSDADCFAIVRGAT